MTNTLISRILDRIQASVNCCYLLRVHNKVFLAKASIMSLQTQLDEISDILTELGIGESSYSAFQISSIQQSIDGFLLSF